MSAEFDAPRGFVPMRDYLKLRARCDDLEERLACARDDDRAGVCDAEVRAVQRGVNVTRQMAELIVILLRLKRPMITGPELQKLLGVNSHNHISVVLSKLRTRVRALGGPLLIESQQGVGGGRWLTPEGRAWLAERVPELFETKGAGR